MAPEADRRFFGNALRIGFNSAKKLLDLFKGLPIAMRDVTLHFRLHSFTPNTCRVLAAAATLMLKLTRAGGESFDFGNY